MKRLYLDAVLFSGHLVSIKITKPDPHTHTHNVNTGDHSSRDLHGKHTHTCFHCTWRVLCVVLIDCMTWLFLMFYAAFGSLTPACVCVQVSRRWSKIMWRSPRRWRRAAWLTWSSGRAGVNPPTHRAPLSRTSRHTHICPRASRRHDSLQVSDRRRDAPYLITASSSKNVIVGWLYFIITMMIFFWSN